MKVKKRDGSLEELNIKNIQKCTIPACEGLNFVNSSELEVDAHIKFIDGMSTVEIQDALIKTAVEKIDIDKPDWTFVAARLFLYDLYHRVGNSLGTTKGEPYGKLGAYISHAIDCNRVSPDFVNKYDLDDLNDYIDPERDMLFTYLGIKTLYDRYLLKDNKKNPIELPQYMFMAVAMFIAQNENNPQEKAKEFYDVISKFEVMLATPTLSNARTHRHQLSSCYIGSAPDNIEGIFDSFKEMGLLSKFGGGIGWDWNNIRSMGGPIDGHANAAGGTVPFLKINNDLAIAVDQLGKLLPAYMETYKARLS